MWRYKNIFKSSILCLPDSGFVDEASADDEGVDGGEVDVGLVGVLPELLPQRLHGSADGELGSAIGHQVGQAADSGHGGKGDDVTSAEGAHVGKESFQHLQFQFNIIFQ